MLALTKKARAARTERQAALQMTEAMDEFFQRERLLLREAPDLLTWSETDGKTLLQDRVANSLQQHGICAIWGKRLGMAELERTCLAAADDLAIEKELFFRRRETLDSVRGRVHCLIAAVPGAKISADF